MGAAKERPKSKAEQERQLTKELGMTFPASDPPSSTQPGGGIAGPNDKLPELRRKGAK
jgi:hypothetical protein